MAYDRRQTDGVIPQQRGGGPYRDYRLEVGHAEVPVGVPRTFKVVDPERAAVLRAWVECPGAGSAREALGSGGGGGRVHRRHRRRPARDADYAELVIGVRPDE